MALSRRDTELRAQLKAHFNELNAPAWAELDADARASIKTLAEDSVSIRTDLERAGQEGRPPAWRLRREGLAAALHPKSPRIAIARGLRRRELWATVISDLPGENIAVGLRLRSGQSPAIHFGREKASARVPSGGFEEREIEIQTGQPTRLLTIEANTTRLVFQLIDRVPQGRLVWLELRPFPRTVAAHDRKPIEGGRDFQGDELWLEAIGRLTRPLNAPTFYFAREEGTRFSRLESKPEDPIPIGALVSVLLYARNAEATLETSALSVLRQTWKPLELLIVDDASTDSTASHAESLMNCDPRVRFFRNGGYRGRSAARNAVLEKAAGHFFFCLDAGEWLHERVLKRLIDAMLDAPTKKRVSIFPTLEVNETRIPDLQGDRIAKEPIEWIRSRGVATTLFETRFFRKSLSGWDSDCEGSDTELLDRILGTLPDECIVRPELGALRFTEEPAHEAGLARPMAEESLEAIETVQLRTKPSDAAAPMAESTIWMYWIDVPGGRARAPYLDACFESIRRNSGCRVRRCDAAAARELLPELPAEFSLLSASDQSNLFRTGVLAKHGGIYLDADTLVLRPLAPLFAHLESYELVGKDWCPEHRDPRRWYPIASAVLGPVRANVPFLQLALERQLEFIRERAAALRAGEPYPFKWTELHERFFQCFYEAKPRSLIGDGVSTWLTVAGGPNWWGGNLGHPLRTMAEIGGKLPETELFCLHDTLMPDNVRAASVDELMQEDTILAHLLRQALENGPV